MTSLALAVASTRNAKLGPFVSATYAHIGSTCPRACPLRDAGCYAQQGHMAAHQKRLAPPHPLPDRAAPLVAARAEAAAILRLPRVGQPLRLHVSGDCRTPAAARTLAAAVAEWQAGGGGPAWTYTHAWRTVPAAAWGSIYAHASIEHPQDVARTVARGYSAALVVADHPSGHTALAAVGAKGVACPAQTHPAATCSTCRLCFDGNKVWGAGSVIMFAAHGSQSHRVRTTLATLA
jgi:hypothetical protein